jgi:hypothetical protein
MITKATILGGFVALAGLTAQASAAELLVTHSSKGNVNVLSFDIVGEDISGFNFRVRVPGLAGAKIESSGCVSELPAGFDGRCSVNGDVISFFVMGDTEVPLPVGLSAIGRMSYVTSTRDQVIAKEGSGTHPATFEVFDLTVGSPDGQRITSTARIER